MNHVLHPHQQSQHLPATTTSATNGQLNGAAQPSGAATVSQAPNSHYHHHQNGSATTAAMTDKEAQQNHQGQKGFFHGIPSFGTWIKFALIDLLTMAALGAIGLGVYFADPAPTRNFAITFSDGEVVYPEFAYPLRNNIIPIWAAAMLAFFVPLVIFFIIQIRVRSFEDLNTAVFGLLYSLICAAVFQVMIKWLIGGFRPHFLSVCKPVIPAGVVGTGFQTLYFTRAICTGDRKEINDASPEQNLWGSACLLLICCVGTVARIDAFRSFDRSLGGYINGKLKVFSDVRRPFWVMITFFAPLLGAFLISGSLTIDKFHHWYDVLVGGLIGSSCALAAYRISYASIFDFRFNHIPLPRADKSHRRFEYVTGVPTTKDAAGAHGQVGVWASSWRESNGVTGGSPGDAAWR